jgi:uncharacterized protein
LRTLFDLEVPMRDRKKLSANVYLPENNESFPVILNRTPYGKDSKGKLANASAFVESGYAFVQMDVRGRGNSEGTFDPYFQEIEDGYDSIEWVASREWCDGNVGTIGSSYEGALQLSSMRLRPPHHKAAFIKCTPSLHPFRDCSCYTSGVFLLIISMWYFYTSGRTVKDEVSESNFDWESLLHIRPLSKILSELSLDEQPFLKRFDHLTYDAYLKQLWEDDMSKLVDVPCYFVSGWFDDALKGAIDHFSQISRINSVASKKQKLLIGPWAHRLSTDSSKLGDFDYARDSLVQLDKEALRWFDFWLMGKKNGIMDEPQVRLFLMGENRWMEYTDYPVPRHIRYELLLGSDGSANSLLGRGRLSGSHGRTESSSFTYDPQMPVPAPYWREQFQCGTNEDLRSIQRRDDVLVYTSNPLDSPLDVVGNVETELYVSTSARDTDFFARLSDVFPSGYAMRLGHGIARLRYRFGYEESCLVSPGEIVKINIDMWATGNRFLPGHSVRLEVTSSAFPVFAPNFNSGGNPWEELHPVIAKQTVYHSQNYPSKLFLTVAPEVEFVPY